MTDRDVGIRDSSTSAGRAGSFSTVTFRMGVCVHRPSPVRLFVDRYLVLRGLSLNIEQEEVK